MEVSVKFKTKKWRRRDKLSVGTLKVLWNQQLGNYRWTMQIYKIKNK